MPYAVRLTDGRVLVAGGIDATDFLNSVEIYNPGTGTWSPTGNLLINRASRFILLPNGHVLGVGGQTGPIGSPTALASAEIYDPASGTWRATGSLSVPRTNLQPVLLADGRVLVAGGNPAPSAELFTPTLCVDKLTITTGDQTTNEGQLLQVTLTATSPTTNPLSFTVSSLPPGATFNATTGQIAWRPAPNQAGSYDATVTVTDTVTLASATKTLSLTAGDTIADTDLDGFPDVATTIPGPTGTTYPKDNCGPSDSTPGFVPNVFNANQADFDGDGLGDLCDPSPIGAAFTETNGQPDPKVVTTDTTVTAIPNNGPIFVTATVIFQRVDQDGDRVPDKYFAVHPDAFNVFLDVVNTPSGGGTPVVLHVNRIAEAPALHIPNSLIEIPGGAGTPCPPGTTQVATGQAAPFNTACQASTVIELTDGRTGFVAGTLAITPTYFNFIKDPEYNAVATPENPTVCTTEAQGCFSPVWMGVAPGPTQVVTVTGGTAPAELTAQGSVSPPTWDLRWDTQGATGFVDLYVGNLTGVCPAGATCAADKIVGSQVLLNGTVVPSSSDVLPSFTGFTGSVLHLRYPQATAMASLKAWAGATLIAGQSAPISLTGVLTSNGLPGPVLATVRAMPTVTLTAATAPTLLDALIAKVQGLPGVTTKLKNDLIGKLTDAKTKIAQGKPADACLKLTDFLTKVNAESGKGLTVAQANDLRADALFIKTVLGCP